MNNQKGFTVLVFSSLLSFFLSLTLLTYTPKPITYNYNIVKMSGTIKRYTANDVTCLARNIYFEARNESIFGQHSVAWVTLNRVNHKKWPNDVCKVVYQRKQFSWTIRGKYKKTYNKFSYKRAILIAKDTLDEYYNGDEDLSNGALYYHADYVKPIWRIKLQRLAQVDTHIFYKNK